MADIYYDPYDVDIDADPYPVFRRLREEAPLYYNEQYDFFAVSRYEDVRARAGRREALHLGAGRNPRDHQGRHRDAAGNADLRRPAGAHHPPQPALARVHAAARRRARAEDPRVLRAQPRSARRHRRVRLRRRPRRADADAGDRHAVRHPRGRPGSDPRKGPTRNLRTEAGQPMEVSQDVTFGSDMFADYIDWRVEHPSDDLMTELLQAEFEDETGTTRRLTRDEALLYTTVVAGAGNETTTRLIGWAGKVLAEHPDQRRELVEDRSLIPNAIEELLRYEPPAPHVGRYVPDAVEVYGTHRSRRQRDVVPRRRGQPRRPPLPTTRTGSTSTARSTSTSRSATASTSVSARRWPGSKAASRSTRCSRASRSGTSTSTGPSSRRPRPCAAGRRSRPRRRDAMTAAEQTRARRRYDSPVRRQRAAETRERIVVRRRRDPARPRGLELRHAHGARRRGTGRRESNEPSTVTSRTSASYATR